MKEFEPDYDQISRLAFAAWENERCSEGNGLQFWLDWQARAMSLSTTRGPATGDHQRGKPDRRVKTARATP
jgi:hypothetical protein